MGNQFQPIPKRSDAPVSIKTIEPGQLWRLTKPLPVLSGWIPKDNIILVLRPHNRRGDADWYQVLCEEKTFIVYEEFFMNGTLTFLK